jgi:hypothetical protein
MEFSYRFVDIKVLCRYKGFFLQIMQILGCGMLQI